MTGTVIGTSTLAKQPQASKPIHLLSGSIYRHATGVKGERSEHTTGGGYSARSMETGSMRMASITAGSAASTAASRIVNDGSASMAGSLAFT